MKPGGPNPWPFAHNSGHNPEGLQQEQCSHVSSRAIDRLEFVADGPPPAVVMRTGERVQVLDLLRYDPGDLASDSSDAASEAPGIESSSRERLASSSRRKLAFVVGVLALSLLGVTGLARLGGRKFISA